MPTRHKKRVQLGIIVSRETKTTVERLARDSGRSQGQVCEELIEKGLAFDSTLAGIRDKLDEIRKGNAEMELRRLGYTPIRHVIEDRAWKLWAEPNFPGIERSSFKPIKPTDPEASLEPVEVPPPEPLSEEETDRNRDHEERIARLEAMAKGAKK